MRFRSSEKVEGILFRLFPVVRIRRLKTIHDNYLRLIHSAKDHVYLQTPYFIPDDSIFDALKIASSFRGGCPYHDSV